MIDCSVKNSIVGLAIGLKGNSKRISDNLLSPLGAHNDDLGAALLTLLTGIKLRLQRRLSVGLSKLDRLILLVMTQFKSLYYNLSVLNIFSTAFIPWIGITSKTQSKKGVASSTLGVAKSFLILTYQCFGLFQSICTGQTECIVGAWRGTDD